MKIHFKWNVGDVVTVPCFSKTSSATITERRFIENINGTIIEYETDLFLDGTTFTQEEVAAHN
ncbi:hypothetical protein FZC83_02160 [Rossellomorea marisflavi]|uniref:Uncharacterized protein n=1 Tax=Rossellomorea marisflavi TaxID=189381 RepID=A0A5D4RZL0_9BACI|nr:hypothetical protein [Rossellomorea marisflavi]TYS56400.1 hypothetical protein FZC83_02160 [Rossellomorea marisflavi]